jgi:hypothetical protein
MPGADELFRPTAPAKGRTSPPADEEPDDTPSTPRDSGRIKHDEKMTVYVTSAELLAIEQARLGLRRTVGRNVDRGRLVRAAIALALEDLEERGEDSDLARRLGSA